MGSVTEILEIYAAPYLRWVLRWTSYCVYIHTFTFRKNEGRRVGGGVPCGPITTMDEKVFPSFTFETRMMKYQIKSAVPKIISK
jgi:hypothetical protein